MAKAPVQTVRRVVGSSASGRTERDELVSKQSDANLGERVSANGVGGPVSVDEADSATPPSNRPGEGCGMQRCLPDVEPASGAEVDCSGHVGCCSGLPRHEG